MSELTTCNYCDYKRLVRIKKAAGIKVKLVADPLVDEKTGEAIFAAGVRAVDAKTGKDLGHWFAEIPKQCCC